jgi:hypothetical protein
MPKCLGSRSEGRALSAIPFRPHLENRRLQAKTGCVRFTMRQHIGCVSLLVRDYDEAIGYFTGRLGFELVEDSNLGNGKRWVLIAPPGSRETYPLSDVRLASTQHPRMTPSCRSAG